MAAALDRQLMIWSDRGGASRHIGDRWAIRCAEVLRDAEGTEWPIPHDDAYRIVSVMRLDDVPEVSKEANRHQLENPDFLLIGTQRGKDQPILQAADAKFAPDRIRPSQVSAAVVSNLLDVGGAAHQIVDETRAAHGLSAPRIVRGVFLSPESEMSEHLLRRVTTGRRATVDRSEVVTIPPRPDQLFVGLPESRLIGPLARIDELPVTPRNNLISAIYYFRLSCACFYLWGEEHRPLLTSEPASEPEPGMVAAAVTMRAERATNAFEVVERWSMDVEPQVRARTAIGEVATLPIRIREVRAEIEKAGLGGDNKVLRIVRGGLESAFRSALHDEVGDILADDPRSLSQILNDVATASRGLRKDMLAVMRQNIEALRTELPEAAADN
ncbi:MAG: hypothetical protein M9890_01855 [Thermomicrobiales bacterium]|nr:hypothetical protein [Thermomicrobiales bacterium]